MPLIVFGYPMMAFVFWVIWMAITTMGRDDTTYLVTCVFIGLSMTGYLIYLGKTPDDLTYLTPIYMLITLVLRLIWIVD